MNEELSAGYKEKYDVESEKGSEEINEEEI